MNRVFQTILLSVAMMLAGCGEKVEQPMGRSAAEIGARERQVNQEKLEAIRQEQADIRSGKKKSADQTIRDFRLPSRGKPAPAGTGGTDKEKKP